MPWKRSFLVVANVTATSERLVEALRTRAAQGPASFTLVIPATAFGGGRAAALQQLEQALEQLREAGLEAEGSVGNADPILAVADVWDPKRYDEIIISTLPMRFSKWLHAGLPERIAHLTDATVTHVVSDPPRPELEVVPPPTASEDPMGPLSVLKWSFAGDYPARR
jgi:GABA permease